MLIDLEIFSTALHELNKKKLKNQSKSIHLLYKLLFFKSLYRQERELENNNNLNYYERIVTGRAGLTIRGCTG
jgi:hypothetical protein